MAEQVYFCAELGKNLLGGHECKKWVAYQIEPDFIPLTREQVYEIGGILIMFFVAIVIYMMLVKAIKQA